jgi:hypothetical protein
VPAERPEDERRDELERLLWDLDTAWLKGSDADVSRLIDAGLRDPRSFAWALARRGVNERTRLLWSVQRALVGATSPSLYGVCAAVETPVITLTFYVASTATEDEIEDLRVVGSEVIADFTDNFTIEDTFHSVVHRDEPLRTTGTWVHRQRGFRTVER